MYNLLASRMLQQTYFLQYALTLTAENMLSRRRTILEIKKSASSYSTLKAKIFTQK